MTIGSPMFRKLLLTSLLLILSAVVVLDFLLTRYTAQRETLNVEHELAAQTRILTTEVAKLSPEELEGLSRVWSDLDAGLPRRSLPVRLFNVSSMLSNVLVSDDGKTLVVHLVNYSDYPVEGVTVHVLGDFRHATLSSPDGVDKPVDLYRTEDGWGVDIERVLVCATIRLEK